MESSPSPSQLRDLPRPLGFVLSGGSSLGALQVGMLRAVQEAGLTPDLLVGTSAGALNAAFIGAGFTSQRVDELEEVWGSITTTDVFAGLGMWSAVRSLLGWGTLASPTRLRSIVERHLPASHADLAVPTTVVAADHATGRPVLLSSGDLRGNVMASAAIPGVFPPVRRGDQLLLDGGVVAHVPILPAKELGCRTMVVLDAGFP
jgi:NTE family protein